MSQKIRLLYLNSGSANYPQITGYLDRAGVDYLMEQVEVSSVDWGEVSKDKYDLVLLETGPLNLREDAPLIILIVDGGDEESAVAALEQGQIADYVLNTSAGLQRLPLAIRAALARNDNMSKVESDLERLRFFAQFLGGYDALVVVDQTGKLAYKTDDSIYFAGYSAEEYENINPFDLISKSDAKTLLPIFSRLVASPGKEELARIRFLHKDGSWHWYDVAGKNMLNDALVQGILIRYSDVTKRMQDQVQQDAVFRIAQAALATDSLDDLFSSIHTIISEVMPAENFYIALYDSETDLVDFPYYQDDFDDPPPGPEKLSNGLTAYVIRTQRSLLADRKKFEYLLQQNKVAIVGTPFAVWLGVPLFIGKQVIGVMGVQHYEDEKAFSERDLKLFEFVSSQVAFAIYRKQTETELRENEDRFRSLFENSTIGIYRSTPDGRLLLVNPTLLRISGYDSPDELLSSDLNQMGYVHTGEREHFRRLLERDGEVRDLEAVWRKKDGSAIYVRESARVIRSNTTGEVYYEGVVEDITERKKAELALQEKVAALETLAEIDNEILLTRDSSTLLEMVCRRAVDLLKASKACIVSIKGAKGELLAIHGFQDVERVREEFLNDPSLEVFNRRESFAIRRLSIKNFPVLMPDTRTSENIYSVIAESFTVENDFRAVLTVFDQTPRNWSKDDRQLLKFLVGQIALSMEKTKLLAETEQRAENFEALYFLGGEIASRRDFTTLLNVIVESVIDLFSTDCGLIYLYDDEKDNLKLSFISGVDLEPGFTIKIGEGLAGSVAKSRKPKRLDNYHTWRNRINQLDDIPFSAILAVPMVYSGQLIGVLAVSELGGTNRKFSDEDMRLLSIFAGQAASAVFNARLFSELKQRNDELDRLHRALGLLIAGVSTDRHELCQGICDIVVSEFNHTSASIWLINEGSHSLEQYGAAGAYVGNRIALTLDGKGLIPKAMREKTIVNVGDVRVESDYLAGWESAASELIIPLDVEEKAIGAIDLQNSQSFAFSQSDERLMTLFANRAALLLEHVRLVEQTEERNRRLDTLHAIEIALASSLDLRITFSAMVEQLQSRLDVDAVAVLVFDQNIQMLEYVIMQGFKKLEIDRHRIRVGESVSGRAALDQEIVYIPDLTRPEPASQFPEHIAAEGFVSAYIVPLVAKGQLYGLLEMFYRHAVQSGPEWLEFLETLARQVAVAIDGIYVFDRLQHSLMEQQVAQDATLESWSHLLEMRGVEPEGHSQRVTSAVLNLAQRMGIEDALLANIYRGALLHDIGKLLLPDFLAKKTGSLTDEEWQLIYQHPIHAHDLLTKIAPFRAALAIPYCHHENWDGSGYPRGLKGEQIPIEARIFQVVETWDLMLVDLPHRKAFLEKDVQEYIRSQAGLKFDPHVVKIFFDMINPIPS